MSLTKATYSMIDGSPINIKDYGAVDGQDSTIAIQAALDAATGVVIVPPGTYIISSISIPSSVELVGYGASSILQAKAQDSASNVSTILMGSASTAVSHAKIKNLKLDGNKSNNTGAGYRTGIRIWGSDYNEISNCIISNFGVSSGGGNGYGVYVGYESGRVVGSNGNLIQSNEVYDNDTMAIAITYGNENSIVNNKVSGTIDLEMNVSIGEIKNNLVEGNGGRTQSESKATPRISDLDISLSSLNTTIANYNGNIISNNHCYRIQFDYTTGTQVIGNLIVGSVSSQTYLVDFSGVESAIVSNNHFVANTTVATSLVALMRTRGCVNLSVTNNVLDNEAKIFHEYTYSFGGQNAAKHYFRGNQRSGSGAYRNGSYPFPSEWGRFAIQNTNGGNLNVAQIGGVYEPTFNASRSGSDCVLGSAGNGGTGWVFNILPHCNATSITYTGNMTHNCTYKYTASGSGRTVTAYTFAPAAGAISQALFDFGSAGTTGCFIVDIYY